MQKNIETLLEKELEKNFIDFLIIKYEKIRKILFFSLFFLVSLNIAIGLIPFLAFPDQINKLGKMKYLILIFSISAVIINIWIFFSNYFFLKRLKKSKNEILIKHKDLFRKIFKFKFLKKFQNEKYLNFYDEYFKAHNTILNDN